MKTNVKKQLIVCVLTLIVLAITVTQTFASNTITDANEIRNLVSGGNTNQLTNENATNILEGQNRNNTTNTNITNITNTNITTNNTTNTNNNVNSNNNATNNANKNELPDTGLDTPSIAIVVICVVSAIYAYKKIRDYNNI